jgi:hypothetical protein
MYKCWKVIYKYADYWWIILIVTLKPSMNLDLTFPLNISNAIKHTISKCDLNYHIALPDNPHILSYPHGAVFQIGYGQNSFAAVARQNICHSNYPALFMC